MQLFCGFTLGRNVPYEVGLSNKLSGGFTLVKNGPTEVGLSNKFFSKGCN